MQRTSRLLAVGFALLLGLPSVQAATFIYSATLSGANENPVVASPGTGNTVVTLNTTAHTLRVQATFSGLTSNTTASHIHCCVTVPGGNAGVATTTPSFVGFPLGVTSGTFDSGMLDMTLASTWNPAFVTANGGTTAGAEAALTAGLAAGTAYFNIHTVNNGGGEIRGFLVIQPIVVNSTADVAANDGQCTLREAITAANTNTASGAMVGECAAGQASPTVDTITFNIPGAGVKTITPLSSLPTITEAVTINGYTQPGASPNTNAMNAGINAVLLIEIDLENFNTIRIGAAGTTIRGLVVNRGTDKITVEANNATIAGNFLGTNPTGTASSNSGSGGFGVRQNSGNNLTVGGPLPADRNLISGSVQGGIATDLGSSVTSTGHVIEGNYIGPDVTGTLSLSLAGTNAISGLNNAIVRGNLISGNNGGGIIAAHQTGNGPVVIQGNLIGTQRNGTSPLGNGSGFGGSGVTLLSSNNTVGGSGAGEPNTIAFNAGPGVGVANNTEGNRIAQNSIYSNGALGISLATQTPGNPLANDAGDADTVPGNNGQNYPVITSAVVAAGNATISGTLNSTANTAFRVEFFASAACDTSGFGEGQSFIGFTNVTTDGAGNASFGPLVFAVPAGQSVITSTATDPAGNTSEFSACPSVVAVADLTITKTHVGNFTQGQVNAMYTITVTNVGTGPTAGTVTVSDTLPAGLTLTGSVVMGWGCVFVGQVVTCTRSDVLAPAASYPPITLTMSVAGNAPASVINTATVSGGGETNTANNSASDTTTITVLVADLTINKAHVGNFTQGQIGATYNISVSNAAGAGPTVGTVTMTDTVPAGLTPISTFAVGWNCGIAAQVVTCTRNDVLAGSSSYPAITLTVNVAGNAPASVTNTATVSGGGETNTANNSASDVTIINPTAVAADLTITKTHSGNFTQGQVGATYTITVTNSGTGATAGTVMVSDTVPGGLTPTGASGTGWSCGVVAQVVTCTRSDALAVSSSYPPITLTVSVAGNASNVINVATVSGGGETNIGNNSASDGTTVVSISAPAAVIPTQSESILMLISALLAMLGLYALKRRVRG